MDPWENIILLEQEYMSKRKVQLDIEEDVLQ